MISLTTAIKHFASLNHAPGATWAEVTKKNAAQAAPAAGGAGPGAPVRQLHYMRPREDEI